MCYINSDYNGLELSWETKDVLIQFKKCKSIYFVLNIYSTELVELSSIYNFRHVHTGWATPRTQRTLRYWFE